MIWNKLQIKIEYPEGSVRSGKDKDGNAWQQRMPYDYGEIVGTKGPDKEPVDVIVGDYLKSPKIFVCTLPKAKSGEEKILIGFINKASAKKAFIACYGGDVSFFKSITEVSLAKLKSLLKSRRGLTLLAMNDFSEVLSILEPLPTGYNTSVKQRKTDSAHINKQALTRQGKPEYATVSQGADLNVSPSNYY